MKTPNFTDTHRFPPGGYVSAVNTDIRRTFARERERHASNTNAQKQQEKQREPK